MRLFLFFILFFTIASSEQLLKRQRRCLLCLSPLKFRNFKEANKEPTTTTMTTMTTTTTKANEFGNNTTDRKVEELLDMELRNQCLQCFTYSTKRTLDCLRRPLVQRIFYLKMFFCLRLS